MLSLDSYRAAVRLDEPTTIEPASDWADQLEPVLSELGVSVPPGGTPQQLLDVLAGILARVDPFTLEETLVARIESILAAVNERRLTSGSPNLAASTTSTYPALEQLSVVVADITTLDVDAIVNAANKAMLGCRIPNHRCIDNAIHSAAGPRLRDDCESIMAKQGRSEAVGAAKVTRGYALPAPYVLHTVGPQLQPGNVPTQDECEQLASAYRSCLDVAADVDSILTIAFCGISTGVFSFPRAQAASIALRAIAGWFSANPHRFNQITIDCYTTEDADYYLKELHDWT